MMPLYDYTCKKCGHEDTLLEKWDSEKQKTCPECDEKKAFERQTSTPGGFVLKGDGFYKPSRGD